MAKQEENTNFKYGDKQAKEQENKAMRGGPGGGVRMVSSKEKQSFGQMMQTLGKVFKYIGKYKNVLFLGLALACASSILLMLGPNQVGRMADIVQEGLKSQIDIAEISKIGFILIAIYGASNLFSFIQQYTMAGMTAKVCKKLRSDFIEKLNRLPHSYFNTHLQGDILSCITNDIQTLRQGISRCLPNLTKSIAQFLTCLVMMIITE